MDLITLEVDMQSAHLGTEVTFSKKISLRGCLPFFDLEIQTFLKIRIWGYGIDFVLVIPESSHGCCVELDVIIRMMVFALPRRTDEGDLCTSS